MGGGQVRDRELIDELRDLACWRPINTRLGKVLIAAADRIERLMLEHGSSLTEQSPVAAQGEQGEAPGCAS
jgi:hypothetical protein